MSMARQRQATVPAPDLGEDLPRDSAWAVALRQYERAADRLDLSPCVRDVLRLPEARGDGPLSGADGRRADARLHRLSGLAQRDAGPGQGRHSLPPATRT